MCVSQRHTLHVKLRVSHIVHSVVVLVVLVQLGFASAFLVDAIETSGPYDALAAHRVPVTAHLVGCFPVTNRYSYVSLTCRVTYKYDGQQFQAWIPRTEGMVFYVDPLDTSYRMNHTVFVNATTNIDGDRALAIALFIGAALVTVVHQFHLYKRRQRLKALLQHVDRLHGTAHVAVPGAHSHHQPLA